MINSNQKKILIFSSEFPPTLGGAGSVAEQNAIALAELGHDVTVLTKFRKEVKLPNEKLFKMITVKTLPKLWFLGYMNATQFKDYDFIFLNDVASIYTAGLLFSKSLLTRCLCFLHGSEIESIYKSNNLIRKITWFKLFYSRALRFCKLIISPSYFLQNKFIYESKISDINWNKVIVSYAGVNERKFFPDIRHSLRKELSIPENSILLVSVSRVVKEKGYPKKYEIFQNLITKHKKQLYWLIVGEGEYLEKLKNKVKQDSLQERVIFLGKLPRNELRKVYSSSDLFWLLSDYEESFGLVYIEAQMCGIPVVAQRKGGVTEAVKENVTGFLVDNQEQCQNLLKLEQWKNLKRENILAFANYFSLRKRIQYLLNFLLL